MDGFDFWLIGVIFGLIVALMLRSPSTVIIPSSTTYEDKGDGCLGALLVVVVGGLAAMIIFVSGG